MTEKNEAPVATFAVDPALYAIVWLEEGEAYASALEQSYAVSVTVKEC